MRKESLSSGVRQPPPPKHVQHRLSLRATGGEKRPAPGAFENPRAYRERLHPSITKDDIGDIASDGEPPEVEVVVWLDLPVCFDAVPFQLAAKKRMEPNGWGPLCQTSSSKHPFSSNPTKTCAVSTHQLIEAHSGPTCGNWVMRGHGDGSTSSNAL